MEPGATEGREVNDQLEAMRHVLSHHEEEGESVLVAKCRQWLEEDTRGFMAQKSKLEEADILRQAAEKREEVLADVKDEGTDKALEVLEKWLKDYERENNAPPDQRQTPG